MEAAVGEYRQPECNSFSDPQPVKTVAVGWCGHVD